MDFVCAAVQRVTVKSRVIVYTLISHRDMVLRHSDSFFFILSSLSALNAATDYAIFHFGKVGGHCLFFAQVFEMQRIVKPGPSIGCNFFLFAMYGNAVLTFGLAAFCCRQHISGSPFQRKGVRLLSLYVIIAALLALIVMLGGYRSTCASLGFSPSCSTEVWTNFDFKTFKPKYLAAYRMPQHIVRGAISVFVHLVFWIFGFGIHWHRRRHSYF